MKKNLVDTTQPFGHVINHGTMGPGSNSFGHRKTISKNKTEILNHGIDHSVRGHDNSSAAIAHAHAHRENEFYWTGHPKG